MDAVFLARLQFAMTLCFHFIFPPITIGLALYLCVVEWVGWRYNNEVYVTLGRLFGKLFAVTFVVGIATGIVMLFQFGTNWGTYSKFVANVFGAPLAAEGFFAFFLESTFMGLYLFGRGRVSKAWHWFSLLMVTVGASTLSSFFIIAANSWQQTPAGYVLRNGRAELTSFFEAVFNPSTLPRYFHVLTGSCLCGAFIFAAVGAWHVLKDSRSEVGRTALGLGIVFGLLLSLLQLWPFGHWHAEQVARTQPEKFAAIEGLYTSRQGAPLTVFGIPTMRSGHPELQANLEIPKLLSLLAFDDPNAYVRGLEDFPREDWPPLVLPFMAYHTMVAFGMSFIALTGWATYRLSMGKVYTDRLLLKAFVWMVPAPVIAVELGWITAEVGRQPWIVYKLLRTVDAASPGVPAAQIAFSLGLFFLVYLALFGAWLFLMVSKARMVPKAENE